MIEKRQTKNGCVINGCVIGGAGLIGFILGLGLGVAFFDPIVSALYDIVDGVPSGYFAEGYKILMWSIIGVGIVPIIGICLGSLFAIIGMVVMLIIRKSNTN